MERKTGVMLQYLEEIVIYLPREIKSSESDTAAEMTFLVNRNLFKLSMLHS